MNQRICFLAFAILAVSLLTGGVAYADGYFSDINGTKPTYEDDGPYVGCADACTPIIVDNTDPTVTYSLFVVEDGVVKDIHFLVTSLTGTQEWAKRYRGCPTFSDLHLFQDDAGIVHIKYLEQDHCFGGGGDWIIPVTTSMPADAPPGDTPPQP